MHGWQLLGGLVMGLEYCERSRIDKDAINRRLSLLGLTDAGSVREAEVLQRDVIRPNLESMVNDFLDSLEQSGQSSKIVESRSNRAGLEKALRRYLLSLGVSVDEPQYFEERLRVGAVHHSLGVPQSVYHASLRSMQSLLVRCIPSDIRADAGRFESLLNFILKVTSLDLSLAVESYCATRMCGLEDSLRDERGESARLRHLAYTDWLTTLHNHAYSRHLLTAALAGTKKSAKPLCVIMADLDQFKRINDRYGHLVGDDVLRITASRMLSAARSGTEIGRYGGEEFLMVLPNADLATAREVAERVRQRVSSDAIHSEKARIGISISLGVAQARRDDSVNSLIERADAALYAAKLAGRDCVRVETSEWRTRSDVCKLPEDNA